MDSESSGKNVVKCQPSGPYSLQVTLPSKYVRANGLEKGSLMVFYFEGQRITYKPLEVETPEPVI